MKAKKISLIIVGLVVAIVINVSAQQSNQEVGKFDVKVLKMKEFHERGGLPNLFHKIKTQRQIRVAYIGGSITAAKEGWRDLTFNWLRLKFPMTAFYQTDASMGGTGSKLGVFRLERDVLSQKPDLVFVEFAVNDGGGPNIVQSMEGIVRKIWTYLPETDICFVYTIAEGACKDLVDKGKPFAAVVEHEKVAEHYKIPSIDMGLQIARMYSRGELVLAADPAENSHTIVFTQDHTHPLKESGHPLYGATVVKYLERMSRKKEAKKHVLPKPYTIDNWELAQMVDLSMLKSKDLTMLPEENMVRFDSEESGFLRPSAKKKVSNEASVRLAGTNAGSLGNGDNSIPVIFKLKAGAELRFRFKGSLLGFYDFIGPGSGYIAVSVDGKTQEYRRFDQYCATYRPQYFFVDSLTNGIHNVEIKVLDKKFDKKVLVEKTIIRFNQPVFEEKNYTGLDWYPGNILIVGKLLDN